MNVEEFVATTLEQIVAGVRRAQMAAANHGGVVNPQVETAPSGRLDMITATLLQDVEFDVAVTVSKASKSGASLRVAVPWVGAGVEGSSGNDQSAISRIKFTVPIVLPKQMSRRPGEQGYVSPVK